MSGRAGGLSDDKPADAEAQEVADKIKPDLEKQTGRTFEQFTVVKYKTQVVAGLNYFLKVRVAADSCVHLKVFRSLDGKLTLTGYQLNKTEDDPIVFF